MCDIFSKIISCYIFIPNFLFIKFTSIENLKYNTVNTLWIHQSLKLCFTLAFSLYLNI